MTSTEFALPPRPPFGRLLLPAAAATFAALYAATRPDGIPLFTAIMGILGIGLAPGLAVSLWAERRFGLWGTWILPLVLSPILVATAALIMAWFGLPIADCAGWIVLGSLLVIAAAPIPQREIEAWEHSLEVPDLPLARTDRQQVVLLATFVLALLALPLLAREWLPLSGDAALHQAAAWEVMTGGLPPLDPMLAGFPLRHFWAYHVYLAVLIDATGLPPATLMLSGSLIAAFVLVYLGYRLLSQLGLSHARCLWGAGFLFFGLNGFFWLAIPLLGPVFSSGVILDARPDTGTPVGFPTGGAFFLETFLAGGPVTLALVYTVLFAMAAVATLGERRWPWLLFGGLGALGLLAFHAGLALIVFTATAITAVLVVISAGLAPWRRPGRDVLAVVPLMVLALCVAYPYLRTVLSGGAFAPLEALNTDPRRLGHVLILWSPSLVLGTVSWFGFFGAAELRRQAWALWSAVLMLVCLVLVFPPPRPSLAPALLAHIPLALTAGASIPVLWRRWGPVRRTLLGVVVVLVLVPRTVMGVWSYLQVEDPRDTSMEAVHATAWIREHTPPDAVLLDPLPDLALTSGRHHLYGMTHHVVQFGMTGDAVLQREGAFFRFLMGDEPTDDERGHLLSLGVPLYYVQRIVPHGDDPVSPDMERVYANEGFRIFLWTPSRRAGDP